jgi:putative peptide zinc metalloprotease protein
MTMVVEDDVLPPRARAEPRPLRLTPGTELLGEFQDSAYQTPKYLVRRADGQVMQLPPLLYRVAGSMDGRDAGQIATGLSSELDEELTAEQVSFLVEKRLRPAGIVAAEGADAAAQERPPVKSDPLLGLRYRIGLVPAAVTWRVAGVLRPFFARPVWVVAVAAFVAVHVAIVARGNLLDQGLAAVDQVVRAPVLLLLVYVVQTASATWHECGHVTACRYGGARPGNMGVGLYIVWPAFYSTVTDSYRLDRVGRLRTDLGGIYFDTIFMTGVGLLYLYTGQPWILIALLGMLFETAWQFLPSIRLDGYYILADLVGVPDLFGYLGPALSTLIPGRPTHPKIAELRPAARRVIIGWVALTVPALLCFLIFLLLAMPYVLPVVWDALLWHVTTLDASIRAGDVVVTMLGVVEVFLLVLPWLGVLLVWAMIWGTLRRVAATRWGWAWAQPEVWAIVRTRMAAVTATGLAVVLVWRIWVVAMTAPPGVAEARIAASTLGVLELGRDAAPAVPAGELVVREQLVAYAWLTGAFERHADVLAGARELTVVACAVLVVCLLAVRATLGWRYRAIILPLAAVAAMGPAVSTLAAVGPGVVGAAWTAVGGTLLVAAQHPHGRHRRRQVPVHRRAMFGLGVAASAVGVATAPAVAVPLAVGVLLLLLRPDERLSRSPSWIPLVVSGFLLTLLAGAALPSLLRMSAAAPLTSGEVWLLIILAGLVSVAGAVTRGGPRGMSVMAVSLVLLALVPVSGAGAVLPLLVCVSAALGALVVVAWIQGPVEERPRSLVQAAVAVPVALVVVVGGLFVPPRAPDLPHEALAQWITGPGADVPVITTPVTVWAELLRDGVPQDRLVPGDAGSSAGSGWEVVVGERSGEPRQTVAFGSGDDALTVIGPG